MRRRYVGLLVLGSLLLAGCGNQASAGHHSDPMYGAPPVGACYALTSRQIDQIVDERNRFSHGRRVSCSSSHTGVTAGLAVLPHGLRWSDGGKGAYLASLALCNRLSARTISADPALAHRVVWCAHVDSTEN